MLSPMFISTTLVHLCHAATTSTLLSKLYTNIPFHIVEGAPRSWGRSSRTRLHQIKLHKARRFPMFRPSQKAVTYSCSSSNCYCRSPAPHLRHYWGAQGAAHFRAAFLGHTRRLLSPSAKSDQCQPWLNHGNHAWMRQTRQCDTGCTYPQLPVLSILFYEHPRHANTFLFFRQIEYVYSTWYPTAMILPSNTTQGLSCRQLLHCRCALLALGNFTLLLHTFLIMACATRGVYSSYLTT